jgi:tetratricopeptide (TPR) repeat protein
MLHEVKRLRGLESQRAVGVDQKSPAALRALLDQRINEEYTSAQLKGLEKLLALTGLIPADYDLIRRYIELMASQALGFYDFETETFILSTLVDPELHAPVVLHELTHALQDQHFGIHQRLRALKDDEDARSALQAVIEGEATALMLDRSLEHTGRRFYTISTDELQGMLGDQREQFKDDPPVIRDFLYFPYEAGLPFMRAVRQRRPWSGVDELYRSPPSSTEQVLHPERFLISPDPPRRVRWPKAVRLPGGRWRRLDANTMGEIGAYLLLKPFVDEDLEAREAAAGWGGDRYMVVEDASGGRASALLSWVWDTTRDAEEFARAYRQAVAVRLGDDTMKPGPAGEGWVARQPQGLTFLERRAERVLVLEGVPPGALKEFRGLGWSAEVAPSSVPPPPSEGLARRERYRRRAEVLLSQGKQKAAASAARQAVDISSDDAEALYLLGAALVSEDVTLADGMEQLAHAVNRDPSLGPALLELGRILKGLDMVDEARSRLERAQQVMPDHPGAARAYGELLLDEGQVSAAWKALEPLYSDPRRDSETLTLMGRVALARGRLNEARGHLRASLDLSPSFEALVAMGALERKEGDPDAAERHLKEASNLDAGGGSALVALGELYREVGRPLEARLQFEVAASRKPDDPSAPTSLGELAQAAGETQTAETWFSHALASDPRWRQALKGLEAALSKQGRPTERVEGLLARPASLDATVRKAIRAGRRCLERGLLRRARQQFETAVRVDGEHPRAWIGLGDVHLREERHGLAKVAYLKALNSPDPLPAEVQDRLFRWAVEHHLAEASTSILRRFMNARDDGERQRAALALGALGDTRVAPFFLDRLESHSPPVQAALAEALGRLGDPAAVGPLKRLADTSRDPEVRSAARRALERLKERKPF